MNSSSATPIGTAVLTGGHDYELSFTMLLEGPRGEHLDALEQISAARQGVVVLHHSILAFPIR